MGNNKNRRRRGDSSKNKKRECPRTFADFRLGERVSRKDKSGTEKAALPSGLTVGEEVVIKRSDSSWRYAVVAKVKKKAKKAKDEQEVELIVGYDSDGDPLSKTLAKDELCDSLLIAKREDSKETSTTPQLVVPAVATTARSTGTPRRGNSSTTLQEDTTTTTTTTTSSTSTRPSEHAETPGPENETFLNGKVLLQAACEMAAAVADFSSPAGVTVTFSLLESEQDNFGDYTLSTVTIIGDRHHLSSQALANGLALAGWVSVAKSPVDVLVLTPSPSASERLALDAGTVAESCKLRIEVKSPSSPMSELLMRAQEVVQTSLAVSFARAGWYCAAGYFHHGLLKGNGTRATLNSVRLAVRFSSTCRLESGQWPAIIFLEPAAHRIVRTDMEHLLAASCQAPCAGFSWHGTLPEALRDAQRVLVLPRLTRGRLESVQRDPPPPSALDLANVRRGYVTGPAEREDFVKYWKYAHLYLDIPRDFVTCEVTVGPQTLSYPSCCLIQSLALLPASSRILCRGILATALSILLSAPGISVHEGAPPPPPPNAGALQFTRASRLAEASASSSSRPKSSSMEREG